MRTIGVLVLLAVGCTYDQWRGQQTFSPEESARLCSRGWKGFCPSPYDAEIDAAVRSRGH